jgi:nucleotide-binding universal stress UspA family protein
MQTAASCLHTPLLLALLVSRFSNSDSSDSLHRAQKLVQPIAHLLSAQATASLAVLAVQPQHPSWRDRLRTMPAAPDALVSAASATSEVAAVSSVAANADVATDPAITSGEASLEARLVAQIRAALPEDLLMAVNVAQGRPAATILRYAQQIQAGLIAVSSHPAGGARELMLGSVATTIARYAPCHVLVDSGRRDPQQEPDWQRVLLVINRVRAVPGAAFAAAEPIALARQLVPLGVRHVTILYIQPLLNTRYWFGPFATPTPNWQFSQLLLAAQQEQSQRLVQQAEAALLLSDVEVTTLVQTGEAGSLICQAAVQQRADVIILESNVSRRSSFSDRSPLGPRRLTVTADYVLHHAPCPVLLCRTPALASVSKPQILNSSMSPTEHHSSEIPGTR